MVAILSWARCSAAPESPSVVEIPATLSFTELSAAAAVYWAFSVSFCVRNLLTLFLQGRQRLLHLLLFLGQLLVLRFHFVDLGLGGGLAGKRFPGQILPALGQCRLGLILEVINRMLELLLLELDPLARRGDRDQCLANLGDLVEHLLVGQIEHFIGLLGRVERLIGLGREYVVGPLEERHVDLAPCQR